MEVDGKNPFSGRIAAPIFQLLFFYIPIYNGANYSMAIQRAVFHTGKWNFLGAPEFKVVGFSWRPERRKVNGLRRQLLQWFTNSDHGFIDMSRRFVDV